MITMAMLVRMSLEAHVKAHELQCLTEVKDLRDRLFQKDIRASELQCLEFDKALTDEEFAQMSPDEQEAFWIEDNNPGALS